MGVKLIPGLLYEFSLNPRLTRVLKRYPKTPLKAPRGHSKQAPGIWLVEKPWALLDISERLFE
jgi:hypothetical protein